MKNRMFALLTALLLSFVPAARAEDVPAMIEGVLQYKAEQSGAKDAADWAQNVLPGQMGMGGEWYAIALCQLGGYDLTAAHEALASYVSAHTVRAATTRQKLALTLLATGGPTAFVDSTLTDSFGKQGVMSWAWGLHLLNNGCTGPCPAEEVIATLLDLRKADGGWAITGSAADADTTAMVLQSLAPHQADPAVTRAIDAAVARLSCMQLESGAFASYGVECAESTAQVIIALCALDIDPTADSRFIQNGATLLNALRAFRRADGSFSHEKGGASNENATAQALLALAAYQRYKAGEGSLYLLGGDAVPGEMHAAWGWQPMAAVGIGGAAAAVCILLLALGKRHPKNFIAVACIAAVLIAAVFLLDVQSADSYYVSAVTGKDAVGTITLTIRCDTVAGQAAHIPADGLILPPTALPIAEGDTVYTVLTDAARRCRFHLESSGAPGMMYIHGIGNLYEFDFGDLSGWLYAVNGETHSLGCDQYALHSGDAVEWRYTLEMGRDINP